MITRKQVLLECLQEARKKRDELYDKLQGMRKKGNKKTDVMNILEKMETDAQRKVEILQDIIHYLDTKQGREGLADWQRQEMKDPERCRREAMDFALDEIRM